MIAGYDGIAPDAEATQVGVARPVDPAKSGQRDGQNFGLIFEGDLRFTITGKDSPTDSRVLIQAVGDHEAFLYATVNTTLAAGYTVADVYNTALKSFNAYGITRGSPELFPIRFFLAGWRCSNPRAMSWTPLPACVRPRQLIDGKLQMVNENKYIHEAIVLNSETGLIGMPQQNDGRRR